MSRGIGGGEKSEGWNRVLLGFMSWSKCEPDSAKIEAFSGLS